MVLTSSLSHSLLAKVNRPLEFYSKVPFTVKQSLKSILYTMHRLPNTTLENSPMDFLILENSFARSMPIFQASLNICRTIEHQHQHMLPISFKLLKTQ